MNQRIEIPASLYEDELIVFLADRYHTTPQKVLTDFLVQDGVISRLVDNAEVLTLEDNEVEILRGLTQKIVQHINNE